MAPRRICVLALLGLPATGKTSFSRWLLSQPSHERPYSVAHVCYDDFLQFPPNAVGAEFDFKMQRLAILDILVTLVHTLQACKSLPLHLKSKIHICYGAADCNDWLIICDDNNYYRSMRYKLYQFCRKQSLAYAQLFFDCDTEAALQRNALRAVATERVPQHIVMSMAEKLEPPLSAPWESVTLVLDAATQQKPAAEIVYPFILNAFVHSLQPCASEPLKAVPHSPTALHQLDLLLRRRIKELLNLTADAAEKQSNAAILNDKRKNILQALKASPEEHLDTAEDLKKFVELLH